MSLSDIKARSRRALHQIHGEPCIYTAVDGTVYPTTAQAQAGLTLTARFATKIKASTPENDGMTLLEGVERLLFSQDQLDSLGLVLENAATVDFPGFGLTFALDQEMDPDGPVTRYWTVTRE